MKRLFSLLLLATVHFTALAVGPDPWRDWRTADSAHFRIHFRAEHRAVAQQVAAIAERVYPRITQQLAWEPRGRTEILLVSEIDLTNGYSTPLPFNTLGIFLAPPDDGELLDNSEWLDLLITHEFTHIVHLDKVRGAPRVLQYIFGRLAYLFPNAWQPYWAVEGIATYNESEPGTGRGRLYGPTFEAWLRAERPGGFLSLAEINSNGRALPLSKQYLYGAYFYEYLQRVYGRDAIFKYIDRYSGNIVPRVHTNPVVATGKTMDALWTEFLADLAAKVDERAAPLKREPEAVGVPLVPKTWSVDALAPAPGGAVYAVVDDGITRPELQRIDPAGKVTVLAGVRFGTRIDARGEDAVLVAMPEICDNRNLFYDLYVYTPADGLDRITHCARLRRAVWAGDGIVAIHNDAGRTSVVRLARDGSRSRTVFTAPPGEDLVDLAATSDGTRAAVVLKRAGRWSMLELDLDRAAAAPRERFRLETPVLSPRYAANGALLFVAARDGVYNVWRHEPGAAQIAKVTHTYTAVLAQAAGTDGSLTVAVVASQGVELRRQAAMTTLAAATLAQGGAAPAEAPAAAPSPQAALRDERSYLALRSLYPRSWFPAVYADRGLTAIGASTFGSDALGWHQYLATAMWETSQGEPLGSLEYIAYDRHFFALTRELSPLAWTGDEGDEETTVYERKTRGQWISTLPWLRVERRLTLGIGAGLVRTERIDIDVRTSRPEDKRVAAAYFDYDTRDANWLSEGVNRGLRTSLLYETYKPFDSDYDGAVLRFDGQVFLPLGRTVLAARVTEARPHGSTEPYQLGGAVPLLPLAVPKLNDRDLALRGYSGDEVELRGRHARVASLEWRTPIMDIDRHAMVPPVGINRLSGTLFFDIGAAWNQGSPSKYYRGVGAEVLGEVKLLYLLALQLRVGVAVGLDDPGKTRAYAALGRAF